jgi:uncharacterized BrkB/YihY/UPF0761 family membrane protein
MLRGILFALLFIVVGMIASSLIVPLLFPTADMRRVGALSFPIIVIVCGGAGLLFGLLRKKKKPKE